MSDRKTLPAPYLHYDSERGILIPEAVIAALGSPPMLELTWLKESKELLIYGAVGTGSELVRLWSEMLRVSKGGQLISYHAVFEEALVAVNPEKSRDFYIPGRYTHIGSGFVWPGGVAQIAAFQMTEILPWEEALEKGVML
jgi:hypothetical protein